MRKVNYQNVRGTQDYLPKREVIRRKIRRNLEDIFIQYGYQPLETPILNYTELMASKYGGGAEILEEMYTLTDRGERDLALRYDLTIPFAKVMAMNPGLRLPLKRYEIGKVFRDGPIKAGRLREFTQCDADIAGVKSQVAEAELMSLALDAFNQLNVEVKIEYNNRNLLIGMLQVFETPTDKINPVVLILDKLEKVGVDDVMTELTKEGLPGSALKLINGFLTDQNNRDYNYFEFYEEQSALVSQGLKELKELDKYLSYLNVADKCVFNPFLARGLDIYTSTIYEVFLCDRSIKSSIASGGRYDNAIGGLAGTDGQLPTVGISFGLDVIYTYLSGQVDHTPERSSIDYYIVPLNKKKEALLVANMLRKDGYKVECELNDRKVGKALDKANKEDIPNVIIIGENEVKDNAFNIKNMFTGEEKQMDFSFNNK